MRGGKPAIVANNQLARQFDSSIANQAWVTDIAYIRTHEGCLYLAVVLDILFKEDRRLGDAIDDARRPGVPIKARSSLGTTGKIS